MSRNLRNVKRVNYDESSVSKKKKINPPPTEEDPCWFSISPCTSSEITEDGKIAFDSNAWYYMNPRKTYFIFRNFKDVDEIISKNSGKISHIRVTKDVSMSAMLKNVQFACFERMEELYTWSGFIEHVIVNDDRDALDMNHGYSELQLCGESLVLENCRRIVDSARLADMFHKISFTKTSQAKGFLECTENFAGVSHQMFVNFSALPNDLCDLSEKRLGGVVFTCADDYGDFLNAEMSTSCIAMSGDCFFEVNESSCLPENKDVIRLVLFKVSGYDLVKSSDLFTTFSNLKEVVVLVDGPCKIPFNEMVFITGNDVRCLMIVSQKPVINFGNETYNIKFGDFLHKSSMKLSAQKMYIPQHEDALVFFSLMNGIEALEGFKIFYL